MIEAIQFLKEIIPAPQEVGEWSQEEMQDLEFFCQTPEEGYKEYTEVKEESPQATPATTPTSSPNRR